MTDFQSIQRKIHTPGFWQADEADRDALFGPYTALQEADVTAASAYQLGLLALQELVRLELIVKALALETAQPAPLARRGRPPKRSYDELVMHVETGRIEVLHRTLSAAEARALGSRLLEAAAMLEGTPLAATDANQSKTVTQPAELAE